MIFSRANDLFVLRVAGNGLGAQVLGNFWTHNGSTCAIAEVDVWSRGAAVAGR